MTKQEVLRNIPKMDQLLDRPSIRDLCQSFSRASVREVTRAYLDELRQALLEGTLSEVPEADELEQALCSKIRRAGRFSYRPLINATGVVLHTNLGRAPLGEEIARHVAEAAAGYSNLEYNLEEGQRGSRYAHVENLLCRLTGAEAALVVNNNAAAVFLMLDTLTKGKNVAISRGELVEIGGSFRVPDIMARSGAILTEIGTTNKTRLSDYERALDEGAQVLLKTHTSNFRIVGFTEEASLQELHDLAKRREVPLLFDLGSGFLIRSEQLGIRDEGAVYVPDAVKCCDVVCFSGDKLLGGAQAGILLGKRAFIDRMKRNPLNRVLRVDKLTLAALEAVLRPYQDDKQAVEAIPTLAMLSAKQPELLARAETLAEQLAASCDGLHFAVEPCTDEPGGGSLPGVQLPGAAVAVTGMEPDKLERALRQGEPAVIARISKNRLLLSVRTLLPGEEAALVAAFSALEGKG